MFVAFAGEAQGTRMPFAHSLRDFLGLKFVSRLYDPFVLISTLTTNRQKISLVVRRQLDMPQPYSLPILVVFAISLSLFSSTVHGLQAGDRNATAGWTDNSSTRGTLDIIYSCLFTIVACVWSVQHLNVPAPRERSLILEKLKWTAINLIFPELILAFAIYNGRQNRRDLRELREFVAEYP